MVLVWLWFRVAGLWFWLDDKFTELLNWFWASSAILWYNREV